MENEKVGTVEAFDCDVEAMLDQISEDEAIRGKIRYVMLTLTNIQIAMHEQHASELAELRRKLEVSTAHVVECLDVLQAAELTRDLSPDELTLVWKLTASVRCMRRTDARALLRDGKADK
jgi:hypothetical protein